MREYRVTYKGENYSNVGYFFLGKKTNDFIKIEDGDVPKKLEAIGKVEEDDKTITLKRGYAMFDFSEYEDPLFYDEYDGTMDIVFDKETSRGTGDKFDKTLISLLGVDSHIRPVILSFISRIIDTNDNIKRHVESAPGYLMNPVDAIFTMNFYNMVVFNLPEYEKLVNSDNINFLKNNLPKESFEVTEASKLHQVVGLPKFAINAIKEMKMEEFVEPFKELSSVIDGNSLNIVLDFIAKGKLIFDAEYSGEKRHLKKEKLNSFIRNLTKIMERKTYKVTDLLNYFLRQSFYSSAAGYFTFPIDEAMYLNDYLDMCEKHDLKCDKYPSQLRRMHDIVSKNIIALERNSEIQDKEFMDAVAEYKNVERTVSITNTLSDGTKETLEYTFLVPTCIKDIIQEGNIQHHCVSSYSDKIIAKTARVVFMRDPKDIKTPLVTIDIDENYNLIEAKKMFNEDVDAIHMKAINKWIKEIKAI